MFTQRLSLSNQDIRKVSDTQLEVLGSVAETADGRVFRYAKAGATALVAGNLQADADVDSNVVNKAVTAASDKGSRQVEFTAGASQTKDAYRDGYLVVNDATGEGILYAVDGNSGGTAVTVTLKEGIVVALVSGTSEVTLKHNTFDSVVIANKDQGDQAVGVANTAVAAGSFFWVQTRGECSVLADSTTVAKGNELTTSAATNGAVGLKKDGGSSAAATVPTVAIATEATVSTENRAAFLTLD